MPDEDDDEGNETLDEEEVPDTGSPYNPFQPSPDDEGVGYDPEDMPAIG